MFSSPIDQTKSKNKKPKKLQIKILVLLPWLEKKQTKQNKI
jgi:hypothetical protein